MKAYILLLTFILISIVTYLISKHSIDETIVDKTTVIITLTTSPKRISQIKPVLNSINLQTIKPDYIYINLPVMYKRTRETFTKIPDFLNQNNIVINYVEDIGPITKVLPTFKLNFPSDTLIISIDDDIYYGNTMIETILKYHKKFPNKVLTASSFIHLKKYDDYVDSGLIAGYSGVAYPYKLIKDNNIAQLIEKELDYIPLECYYSDDFIISNILLNNNIDILLLGLSDRSAYTIKPLKYGLQEDALYKGGVVGNKKEKDVHINNYKKCAKYYNNKLNKKMNAFLK